MKRPKYGQYCPLSMASEILGTRWTLLVLRELLEGSTQFNDIARGVPLMSRSMLSQRLKDLETAGLLTREAAGPGRPTKHNLTDAGRALGGVIRGVAEWGQEWIDTDPSLEDVDTDFLMWDIRRNMTLPNDLTNRFVLHFHFPDGPDGKTDHWLVSEKGEIDICYIDPGHEIDVHIESGLKDFTMVWMGWLPLKKAQEEGKLFVDGPPRLVEDVPKWLGLSSVSMIEKKPRDLRALRTTIR
ncbi:MAG: helix-turn-helix domain-containing protein [Pseudomonadota bacterium]